MENNKNLVNGPINGFRLEGKVGNINKVVYLFGDYHYPISGETKCDSFTSDDFVNYFYKTMEKTDKNIRYDFIYENYFNVDMFDEYKFSNSRYREKYLDEIRKFVDSDMDIKEYKKDKDNQIKLENKGSKTFKNLRLHYLDVRSFFGRNILLQIEQDNFYFLDNFDKNYQFWIIDRLIINFYNMKNHLNFLADHLSVMAYDKKKKFVDKIEIKDDYIQGEIKKYSDIIKSQEPRMKQYSEKMFKKYKNKEIKDKITNSDILITVLSHIRSVVKKLNGCLKKLLQLKEIGKISSFDLNKHSNHGEYNYGIDYIKTKKLFYQIKVKYEIIYDDYITLYAYLTDLYMLRRFLDKDYIEHAIVYTGMTHTQNYVRTLIKDFGFTITNLDYSKLSIKETNEVIPKKTVYELSELLRKPIFKQCTDMSKFPEKFL